jgi:hypothetical protein
LADRAFSRLLREDWPRTLEELEMVKAKQLTMVRLPANSLKITAKKVADLDAEQ